MGWASQGSRATAAPSTNQVELRGIALLVVGGALGVYIAESSRVEHGGTVLPVLLDWSGRREKRWRGAAAQGWDSRRQHAGSSSSVGTERAVEAEPAVVGAAVRRIWVPSGTCWCWLPRFAHREAAPGSSPLAVAPPATSHGQPTLQHNSAGDLVAVIRREPASRPFVARILCVRMYSRLSCMHVSRCVGGKRGGFQGSIPSAGTCPPCLKGVGVRQGHEI